MDTSTIELIIFKNVSWNDLVIDDKIYPHMYQINNLFTQTVFTNEIDIKSIAEKPSILVMDNHDFNETYLKDLFNEWFQNIEESKKKLARETLFYYCDDYRLRLQLLKPNIAKDYIKENITDEEIKDIEKELLKPCMFAFKTNRVIGYNEEHFLSVLRVDDVDDLFKFLHDENIVL